MEAVAMVPYSDELDWPEGLSPFETVDFEIQKDPYAHYAWMREHAPVLRTRTATRDVWFISRYEDVRAALRAPKKFSSMVVTPPPLVFLTLFDAPEHARLRQVVASYFTPKAVLELEEKILGFASGYLDELISAGGGDVVDEFALRITMATISSLLGIPAEDFDQMKKWSDDVSSFFGRLARQAPGIDGDEAGANELFDYLLHHILTSDPEGNDSLAPRLASLLAEGQLTETEAKHFCAFLFVAGHETTTVLLGNAFRMFAEQPETLARLQEHPEDTPKFIEEMVRFRGTVHRVSRRTVEPIEVAGVTIPAGEIVVLLTVSANRDGQKFANPDVFDIDRDASAHLGFGHGIHSCLGQNLARLEGGIAIRLIAQRIGEVSLDPNHPIQFVTGGNLANSGPSHIVASLTSRTGCPFHSEAGA
ncbi:MAG: cytochrome P450 [Microbacteriaceae bacterium]